MGVEMWIARDADGEICIFMEKPEKISMMWGTGKRNYFRIKDTLFPEVKWEDPEPTKAELKIIK